jgi:L-cysteine S-thiosulfotransferase
MPSRVRRTLGAPLGAALFSIAVLSAPFSNSVFAQPVAANTASKVAKISEGRAIFIDERKGNCAACHKAPNDSAVKTKSNIGMPLEAIKARYPDRAKLRDAIWDLSKSTPNTIMPPYGKNRILSDDEVDALVIYLETI